MAERKDLLAGIADRGNAKPTSNARHDPLSDRGQTQAKAQTDAAAPKSNLGPAKIGLVVLCISVAGVMLSHHFGFITLWGGIPPEPPLEPEVAQEVEKAKVIFKKEQERIEQLPPEKRPTISGS